MFFRHFLLALCSLCLLAGCQKGPEQQRLIMPDLVVAVAPFTQPTQTTELLSGFIPEDQKKISEHTLAALDDLFRDKLKKSGRSYVFLSTFRATWPETRAAAETPSSPGRRAPGPQERT